MFFNGWGVPGYLYEMYLLDIWETVTATGYTSLNMSKTELYIYVAVLKKIKTTLKL